MEGYFMFMNGKSQFHKDDNYTKLVYIYSVKKRNPNLVFHGS